MCQSSARHFVSKNTKCLYCPPSTHAWCLPWGMDKTRSLDRCQLLFLCIFRKTSLPHVAFLALMTGMTTVQMVAALGGRKREMNVTMNWFCQAHAAYKCVRSYFYLQIIARCDEQNIWTWNTHCSIRNTRLLPKRLVNYTFLWEKMLSASSY
jgi:hypothetical protein